MKKNVESLVIASKEVGLQINVEKTKYMFIKINVVLVSWLLTPRSKSIFIHN
jgi:hypothetical protein